MASQFVRKITDTTTSEPIKETTTSGDLIITKDNKVLINLNGTLKDLTAGKDGYMPVIGGRNYVQNSSGFNGSSTARPTLIGASSGASNATITYQSDGVLMTNLATNTTSEWVYQVASAWTNFSDTPLTPGKPITFSVDVMGTVPQAVLRYDINDGISANQHSKNFDINNTSWTRISITATPTSTDTRFYFRIQGGKNNQYANGWTGGETLKFRYVKIEEGNVPTDWTPAPEDVQSDIVTANTAIKKNADDIKTANKNIKKNTDDITQLKADVEALKPAT